MIDPDQCPTPWDDDTVASVPAGKGIATARGFSVPVRIMSEPNWQRSKACVNALAGIDDPTAYVANVKRLADAATAAAKGAKT